MWNISPITTVSARRKSAAPSPKTAQACSAASRTAASCTRCGTIFPNGLSSCYAGRYIVKYAHCTMADKSWNDRPATLEGCKPQNTLFCGFSCFIR